MDSFSRRNVLLVQLPIPPLGPEKIRGNVPLAAAYLKLFAQNRRLDHFCDIQIFPVDRANTLGDQALVSALAEHDPWLVGFTCYVWNIERTLWVAREFKKARPEVRIILGGPEITADNEWVLQTSDYDFAVIGEGEQTFAELLIGLLENKIAPGVIPGLYVPPPGIPELSPLFPEGNGSRFDPARRPAFRTPLPDLKLLGSPYLAGILDAADEQMLLLETTRGCVFKCKFCYYPKSYDGQYYLSRENILANLRHADDRGAKEVFLLDPTMNQRKDFVDFLRVLAAGNPGKRFSYFGELRAEGITEETARLLQEANFTEVEVGLQSINPEAQKKMDRKNNLKAFERGVRAMLDRGITVKVDLIIGLPGDTVESVRRGFHYLYDSGLYTDVQIFNLSILPGTAFRQEARELGLKFQPRPPYYLLQTPTMGRENLYGLMYEAQELFGVEFDAQSHPVLAFDASAGDERVWQIDLDRLEQFGTPDPKNWIQAFTIWFRSSNFDNSRQEAVACIRRMLETNPFTTLQVVLELPPESTPSAVQQSLSPRTITSIFSACLARPTYLDRYYALQPGRPKGAKRLILVLPRQIRFQLDAEWLRELGDQATIVWRGGREDTHLNSELEAHEFAWTR